MPIKQFISKHIFQILRIWVLYLQNWQQYLGITCLSIFIMLYLFRMGNQLCPAKVIIQEFSEIQKGEKNYSMIFKDCLKTPSISDNQIELNRDHQFSIDLHNQSQNLILEKAQHHPYLQKLRDIDTVEVKANLKKEDSEKIIIQELLLDGGSRYAGQTKNGIPNGEGEEFYSDGDHYKGSFINGCKNGKGVYTFANSEVYTGQFQSNMMWGFGVFQFINGDRYEGEFANNVRCGKGKYLPKQPDQQGILFFEGEYRNDLKDGSGRVQYTNHEMKGVWKNGLYEFHLPSKI